MSAEKPSLSAPARAALQVAFAVFREQGEWPSYQYLDHELDRAGEDAASALAEIPPGLAHFDRITPRLSAITLTVAGVCAAEGSDAEQELFLRLLEWCVGRERDFAPASATGPAEQLEVDAVEFAEQSPGQPLDEVEQRKALSFIRTEKLASSSGGPQPRPLVWTATLDPRLRRYRGVETIADYLAAKTETGGGPAAVPSPPDPTPAPLPGLGRGARVTTVKTAAGRLGQMMSTDRELTLRVFGIEAQESDLETTYAFAVRALSEADDRTLLEIAAYLEEIDAEPGTPAREDEPPQGPWEPDFFRLFLSHTHPFAARMGGSRTSWRRSGSIASSPTPTSPRARTGRT
jgi:hypothetical protein